MYRKPFLEGGEVFVFITNLLTAPLHCAAGTCFPRGVSQAPTPFRLCGLALSSFEATEKVSISRFKEAAMAPHVA